MNKVFRKTFNEIKIDILNGKNPQEIKGLTIFGSDIDTELKRSCELSTEYPNGDVFGVITFNNDVYYVKYSPYEANINLINKRRNEILDSISENLSINH